MKKLLDFIKKLWNKLEKEDILTSDQQKAFAIFAEVVNSTDYICSTNNDSVYKKRYIVDKCYLLGEPCSMFVILQADTNMSIITIVNHSYEYHVSMPSRTAGKMNKMFDNRLNEDRRKMEEEILKNTTKSLDTILINLTSVPEEKIIEVSSGRNYVKVNFA